MEGVSVLNTVPRNHRKAGHLIAPAIASSTTVRSATVASEIAPAAIAALF